MEQERTAKDRYREVRPGIQKGIRACSEQIYALYSPSIRPDSQLDARFNPSRELHPAVSCVQPVPGRLDTSAGVPQKRMQQAQSWGRWLKDRRRALDLTQDQLAREAGCALITIKKLEADERRPSREIAQRLLEVLDVAPEDQPTLLRLARATPRTNGHSSSGVVPPIPGRGTTEDLSGQTIRGYALREQIGVGGFGAVYRAYQSLVERDVAVKVVLPWYANHPDFIRRFEAEAQLVARLEHPHIVPLYDYWREAEGAYLVMRWMRGGSLAAALRSGPQKPEVVARWLDQVAAALSLAHRQGVIHRDIKPANLLLDEDGNVYLADFGIAQDVNASALAEQPNAAGLRSLHYLAPEQIKDEPITHQTDIYKLGVCIYELLTGEPPLAAGPPVTLLYRHFYEPLPLLHPRRPDMPEWLDAVLRRATAKNPLERYPDILSLAADFRRALATAVSSGSRPLVTGDAARRTAVAAGTAPENPYKGLRAFNQADAPDFFGREALTHELVARLGEEIDYARFLAVVGPSGSGKSSVVRAGLIPALRYGALPGSENWFVVELFPGAYPFEELGAALLRVAVNPPPRWENSSRQMSGACCERSSVSCRKAMKSSLCW